MSCPRCDGSGLVAIPSEHGEVVGWTACPYCRAEDAELEALCRLYSQGGRTDGQAHAEE